MSGVPLYLVRSDLVGPGAFPHEISGMGLRGAQRPQVNVDLPRESVDCIVR